MRIVQSSERKRSTKNGAAASRMKCSGSNQATKRSRPSWSHAAEAHEGVHLVQVAPHGARHQIEPVHQRIAGDLEQIALAVEHAPDEPVEQGVALRIAVADHMLDRARATPSAARPAAHRRPPRRRTGRAHRRSSKTTCCGASSSAISQRTARRKPSRSAPVFRVMRWRFMPSLLRHPGRAGGPGSLDERSSGVRLPPCEGGRVASHSSSRSRICAALRPGMTTAEPLLIRTSSAVPASRSAARAGRAGRAWPSGDDRR